MQEPGVYIWLLAVRNKCSDTEIELYIFLHGHLSNPPLVHHIICKTALFKYVAVLIEARRNMDNLLNGFILFNL